MIKATGYTLTIGFDTEESARKIKADIDKRWGFISRIIKAEELD